MKLFKITFVIETLLLCNGLCFFCDTNQRLCGASLVREDGL